MAGMQLVVCTIFFSVGADLVDHWWGVLGTVSVAGILLGVCQWIWLRQRLGMAWQWIIATLLGWYLAVLLGACFGRVLDREDSNWAVWSVVVIALLAIPVVFSLPQWFLIRRQFKRGGWWWTAARPLAWLTGGGLIALGYWLGILPEFDFWSAGFDVATLLVLSLSAAVFSFGFAAVTGTAFTWIQKNQTVILSPAVVRSAVEQEPKYAK